MSVQGLFRRAKQVLKKILHPIRRHFLLIEHVFPEQMAGQGGDITNLRVLIPAQRIKIASPKDDPFVPVGKYFREGWFDRPDIFVCDIPEAYLHVGSGMVCTRHWKVVADLEYRLPLFDPFGKRRPRKITRLAGAYSTVNYCVAWNFYHWMVDCLPRVISLAQAEPQTSLTLIMPDSTGAVQRESLAAILPPHFEIQYHPADTWLQLERFVWPSLVSGRCNAFLPAEYYEAIRRPIFHNYQLPSVPARKERLYITRRGARSRRILNEEALLSFIELYGFKTVELEKLSFRQQVELFHRADIVLGPHGAGFNLLFFCGKIRVIVLHPNQAPQNQFHTLARGLGQEYHFVLHPGHDEEANFEADLPALKRVFEQELDLRPV